MDFLNRNAAHQPQGPRATATNNIPTTHHEEKGKKPPMFSQPSWLRVALVVMLFSTTVVMVALAFLLHKGTVNESQYVSQKKSQAVFLTNGQVYFGKIASVNRQFIDLRDIYYLNTQQQSGQDTNAQAAQPTNFSLVKLGCELHGPADQMVINRDQVSFWENLKDDGQVAKAIAQFKEQNPKGQTCKTTSDSTQQSTTTPAATTPSSSTTTTVPANKKP